MLKARDLQAIALGFGGKVSESSKNADPQLSSGKIPQDADTPSLGMNYLPLEWFSGRLSPAGIVVSGNPYELVILERPTKGIASSLLPTPLTCSSDSELYRRPGRDKLETQLSRELSLLPGMVSHPKIREWMLGLQENSTAITGTDGGVLIPLMELLQFPDEASPIEAIALQPLETPALPSKPQCAGNTSIISPDALRMRWGVDGVGRGNCAGLNIWCLVGVPEGLSLIGVKDSKLTKAHQREQLAQAIRAKCIVGIGVATPREIDELGIDKAEELALSRAIAYVQAQGYEPGEVMGDLKMPPAQVSTQQVKSADAVYLETSAASVIAKYTLDLYWSRVGQYYPDYGFTAHAGYVKPVHMSAIKQHGLIASIHRFSYKPCKEKAAIDVAANQLNAQGHYTMVAIANTAKKIEDLAVEIASQQEQLKVVQQVYKDDVIGFEERKLKKAEREWKSAESAYKFVTTKIKKLIATLELCQSMPLDSSFTHQHYGEGVLQGFLFDHRGVVMASVNFAEKGITEVSPHEIKVVSGSVEPGYSGFPSDEMIEFKRSKAIWIRDCILAVKSEADYQALRKLPDFTRDQLNWVRKNVLTDEQQKTYTDAIKNNPLPKPVGVGDIVIRPTGEIYGEVKIVQVRGVAIEREGEITKLSWDEFELLQLAKQQTTNNELTQAEEPAEIEGGEDEDGEVTREVIDASVEKLRANLYNSCEVVEEKPEVSGEQNQLEVSESLAVTEVSRRTESPTPVEIAGTSDDDEVERIVEKIKDLDRSHEAEVVRHRMEVGRQLFRLQQVWKPSEQFPSLTEFCTAKIDRRYGKSYRNELIKAAQANDLLASGTSVRLPSINAARPIAKMINKGVEPEKIQKLVQEVANTGEITPARIEQAAQKRGLLPQKAAKPITKVKQEVASTGQSLGLSGRESQQLPDIEPNADIPLINEPTALYNCCSQAELRIFCEQHTQEAIAQLRKLDWERRFELRGLWAEFESWLATCAFHKQIDSQGILTLEAVDGKAKIKWLESEVTRLQCENDELRARLSVEDSVDYCDQEAA
jgi:ribonuclease HII